MEQIHAKKSLGQNFLKSKKALSAMIAAGNISAGDTVLEIGPGQGALTEQLLATGANIIAVEKDDRLIPILTEKFQKEITAGQLKIIRRDILELDFDFLKNHQYKLVANIPYYITGLIFRKFLEGPVQPSVIVIMVQKEIADRIVARDGKESLLSLSVKAYGEAKKVMKVEKEHFSPKPKVDSAILAITGISKDFFQGFAEKRFFQVLKAGFAHKRKVLSANCKPLFGARTADIFAKIGIAPKARAEDLTLDEWRALALSL